MTPAQLALLLQGEAALLGEKAQAQPTPALSDVDDMAAFAATTGA